MNEFAVSILGFVKLRKVFVKEPSSYRPSLFSVVSITFIRLSMIVPTAFFWQFSRSTIVSSVSIPFIPLLTIASVDPQSLRKRFWQSLTEFNMTMIEIGSRIVDDFERFLVLVFKKRVIMGVLILNLSPKYRQCLRIIKNDPSRDFHFLQNIVYNRVNHVIRHDFQPTL